MDSADIPQPDQGEVSGSTKSEIEQIGEKVLNSLKEQPPTPRAEEADTFWSNPTVFTDLGGNSGEVMKMRWATDQNWSRRGFRRIISNQAGEEIGEWIKMGFFHQNPELRKYEDEASFFEEERKLKSQKREELVRVGFDKDRRVSYIRREVYNFDPEASNFREIEAQELDYTYGNDGQIQKIVLTDYEPPDITRERKVRSKKTVFEDREAQQAELLRKHGSSQTGYSSSVQQPVIKPQEKPNIFQRLFRR